jgi:uncharacterized protein DUF4386
VVGIGNGLLLGYLMYRSELVSRPVAILGLIAGPLIIITGVAAMFGVINRGGPLIGIATVPEFIWELFLGIYPLVFAIQPGCAHPRRCNRREDRLGVTRAEPAFPFMQGSSPEPLVIRPQRQVADGADRDEDRHGTSRSRVP